LVEAGAADVRGVVEGYACGVDLDNEGVQAAVVGFVESRNAAEATAGGKRVFSGRCTPGEPGAPFGAHRQARHIAIQTRTADERDVGERSARGVELDYKAIEFASVVCGIRTGNRADAITVGEGRF